MALNVLCSQVSVHFSPCNDSLPKMGESETMRRDGGNATISLEAESNSKVDRKALDTRRT